MKRQLFDRSDILPSSPLGPKREEEEDKVEEEEGGTGSINNLHIEIVLTSASTTSPLCLKPDLTQQMLVEVESREGREGVE